MAIKKFEMPEIPDRIPGVVTNQAAGALICAASTGRFLWQLRGPDGDAPNVYGQFGGGIEPGETREAAVQRELEEEAGYSGSIFIRALKPNIDTGFTYHNHVAVVPDEFEPTLNAESNGHVWCELDQWPSPLHPGVHRLFQDMASVAIVRDTHFRREYLAQFCKRYGTTKMPQFVKEHAMAIKQMELAATLKREDFKEGEVWEARWHDAKGNDGVLMKGTVVKVRARGVEIHWSDNSYTYEVPFKAFIKKVK